VPTNNRLRALQLDAWAFGRSLRVSLLTEYEQAYGVSAPAPARIGAELLTDFLGARLSYDALPLDVYAETTWRDGRPLVTVNSRTREIDGVKDPGGVSNVGVWHEAIHVQRDISVVKAGHQGVFDGFQPNLTIACHRDRQGPGRPGDEFRREYFAEEAGRAAAVSFPHLMQTSAFRDFVLLADRGLASGGRGWGELYAAAEEIGVNISALVRQLEAEGFMTVERLSGQSILHPQPGLSDILARTVSQ
jgi:hypothetical protein